jgi:hypothetical protein
VTQCLLVPARGGQQRGDLQPNGRRHYLRDRVRPARPPGQLDHLIDGVEGLSGHKATCQAQSGGLADGPAGEAGSGDLQCLQAPGGQDR